MSDGDALPSGEIDRVKSVRIECPNCEMPYDVPAHLNRWLCDCGESWRLGDDGLDATTKNMLLDLGEQLMAVDGPLVGGGDRETVSKIVGQMFEAIGGTRLAEVDDDAEELRIEAQGDDTYWRKETNVPTYRAECGPMRVTDDPEEEAGGAVEVLPNGQRSGYVSVDSELTGSFDDIEHKQGALHYLTPRQARTFAAALLEQADCVDSDE